MLEHAALPPLQSFCDGPSTVCCVAVTACTVVMRPSMRPNSSFTTFAIGARQFVVHDAFETTSIEDSFFQIYSTYKHWGVWRGCRDNYLLCTTLHVKPSLFNSGKSTGRFNNIICTSTTPLNF